MATAKLYKVTVNWHGEIHEKHTKAMNKTQALRNGCYPIAVATGIYIGSVVAIVRKSCDYKVEEVE